METKEYLLHAHDDIDYMFKNTNIPIAFKNGAEVYVMQEDRIVFVGKREQAKKFMNQAGKYCKPFFEAGLTK